MSDLQGQLQQSLTRMGLAAFVTFLLLVGLMAPVLLRLVIRPVKALAASAAQIGAGNLSLPVAVKGNDELGQLAGAFEAMRVQLDADRRVMADRNQELQILNDVATAASRLLDPQQIIDLTLEIVVNSLDVEAGAIYLRDQDQAQYVLRETAEYDERSRQTFHLSLVGRAVAGVERGQVDLFLTADEGAEGDMHRAWHDEAGRLYLGIPLQAGKELIGTLALVAGPERHLTAQGISVLKAIGLETGVALASAMSYQRVRHTAAVEEREMVAREMHDSLAQMLGYLKLKASVTDALLSGGQIDQARANLQEVKEIAGETYTDVREAIFGLRRSDLSGQAFLPALTDYLAEYKKHYGVDARLIVENGQPPAFSDEISLQLTRIIQEALTNVRKHAGASQVDIRFGQETGFWRISVEDDGRGLSGDGNSAKGSQSFGLQIMQERAENVGAKLALLPRAGGGTAVVVRVPIKPNGRVPSVLHRP